MIVPADLLKPAGLLDATWLHPDGGATVTAELQGYIDEAVSAKGVAADNDAALRAWSYHRAFTSIWLSMSFEPSTTEIEGEARSSRLISQIDTFKQQADHWLSEFERANAGDDPGPPVAHRPATTSIRPNFTW